jgi:hypothetical protein|tara:strand:- start:183 stop:395 length:213 start_codon:yes stop_codon:yes gene_type:complete
MPCLRVEILKRQRNLPGEVALQVRKKISKKTSRKARNNNSNSQTIIVSIRRAKIRSESKEHLWAWSKYIC